MQTYLANLTQSQIALNEKLEPVKGPRQPLLLHWAPAKPRPRMEEGEMVSVV